MNSITYLILLYNQEKNLPDLVKSLQDITGSFRKEYIIIDDCSTDNSLLSARRLFASFPRTSIISNNEYKGSAYSLNLGIKLASSEYIHFVDGGDILASNSTAKLLKALHAMGTDVACSLHGTLSKIDNHKVDNIDTTGDIILVESPIKELLDNRKVTDIRYIGYSGTLVSSYLLEKISGADEDAFLHNMSLGLRCGKYSKFAFVKETLYYTTNPIEKRYDKDFLVYNSLIAIANFIEDHREISEQYKPEIYKALWSSLWYLGKFKTQTLPKYLLSRYIRHNLDLDMLIELYRGYITRLEK